ncbi:MAG: hypothetical protein ACREOR_12130 [Candidatus Binatia bacterium]
MCERNEPVILDMPDENWLPINRGDEGLDLMLRVYAPDLEKVKTRKAPKAALVK